MVGSISGALLCGAVVISIARQPASTPAVAATSTYYINASSTLVVDTPPSKMEMQSIFWQSSSSTQEFSCFFGQGDTCVVSIQDFKTDILLLKTLRSGNFTISGNNISVPIGNGSSSDLMSVLNYMQSEIAK